MQILDNILAVLKNTLAGRWSEDALTDKQPQMDLTSWVFHTNDCGTSACILGHAMLDPRCSFLADPSAVTNWQDTSQTVRCLVPRYDAYQIIADDTFGQSITGHGAQRLYAWLFMPSYYPHTDQRSLLAVTAEFEQRVELLRGIQNGSPSRRRIFLDLLETPGHLLSEAIDFLESTHVATVE